MQNNQKTLRKKDMESIDRVNDAPTWTVHSKEEIE